MVQKISVMSMSTAEKLDVGDGQLHMTPLSLKPTRPKCLSNRQEASLFHLVSRMNGCPSLASLPLGVGILFNNEQNSERDRAVSSIRCLNVFYGFSSDTFASAVNFLDRFLSKVKVQSKYLSCVAVSCFFIAAKVHQESEELPSVTELSSLHRKTWKASDLKRMEMVILEKLKWETWPVTCPAVIKLICDILFGSELLPSSLSEHSLVDVLLSKFETCINYEICAIYKPTTLALCLLQQQLQDMNVQTAAVSNFLLYIHCIFNVYDSEFHDCYNTSVGILNSYASKPKSHPLCLAIPKPQPRMSLISRPSYYGCTDLPTIEEVEAHQNELPKQSIEDSDVFYSSLKTESWSSSIVPERNVQCKIK